MAGFFYNLTNPNDGHLSSFNVMMNDDRQCVLTQLDSSGKPCDFSTHEDLEDLLLSLARAEAGDNGYHQVWIQRADDGYLCENLMSVGTWQEVADTLNGPDGKDKWVMYGRWATLMPFDYVGSNGQHFAVTDLGKRLDAMHKQD